MRVYHSKEAIKCRFLASDFSRRHDFPVALYLQSSALRVARWGETRRIWLVTEASAGTYACIKPYAILPMPTLWHADDI